MVTTLGDELQLDEALFELRRSGVPVQMEPQTFNVLAYLVQHRDRVVSKEELMDAVWGGRFVSESAVTSRIKQARRALGDDGQAQRYIRTLHGRGYRFVGPATQPADPAPAEPHPEPRATPAIQTSGPVRHTLSDDLHIAYQVTGAAPGGGPRKDGPDIVLIAGFVSHLELDWDEPRHARFLNGLAEMGRLIRFDKRGTGMSDRPEGIPGLETRMHDVLAVMDTVGSRQAVIVGYSEGGPMALLLAATHPERVSRLVLFGSYAKRSWAEDYPWAQTIEQRREYTRRLVTQWDWEADIVRRNPTADASLRRWWAMRMRASATPKTVEAIMKMNDLIDVRHVLPAVKVPTLVLHRRHDALFSVEEAQYLADHLPSSELQVLEGADHFVAGDPDQILDAIRPFVAETSLDRIEHESVLAAVAAVRAGTPEATARVIEALQRCGGRLRHASADAQVVLFDGPATAVRASHAVTHDARASVGIVVAEVPAHEDHISDAIAESAIALAAHASAGEVVTSQVAALLMSGMGQDLVQVDLPSGGAAFTALR